MTRINNSDFIRRNEQDFQDSCARMKWITPEKTGIALHLREELINRIFNHYSPGPGWMFSGTKLFTHTVSPGCRLCGSGDWSCLFINGICNARCFYCPSSQNDPGPPMTSTIEFTNPHDYADYINLFQIKGVSFSGGEPLMTFDRVILFLKTLRAEISFPLYIWMYTNGLLITEDKLKALRDNGLDEIRFDLSANHYHLDALKKAVGVIPCVTVEIPAIPEDLGITRPLIKALHDAGVHHLNLHQLRCTLFNTGEFINRDYTFLHGPGVTVLETELAALELIEYALDQRIDLPVNYCSFTYRHQFQKAGAQKRNARLIKAASEDITLTGHIRTSSLTGEREQVGRIHQSLVSQGPDPDFWRVSRDCDQLFFNESLWPWILQMDLSGVRLKIAYSATALKAAISFRHTYRELALNRNKKVVVERRLLKDGIRLEGKQIHEFYQNFIRQKEAASSGEIPGQIPQDLLNDIHAYESFIPGLSPYY